MKTFNYLLIVVGLMILFNIAGINTASGYVLNYLDIMNPENLTNSGFYLRIVLIFATSVTGGIAIGYITKSSTESILIAPYAAILLLFIADIIFVVSYMNANYSGWLSILTMLLMMPLAVGYLHSVISWWGGKN